MNTDWSFAMHNCSEVKEQITELLLDGADCRSDEVLSAELRRCAECRNEFDVLRATLRITKRSREFSAPTEDYWTNYHAKLRQNLVNVNALSASHKPSRIRKIHSIFNTCPRPRCARADHRVRDSSSSCGPSCSATNCTTAFDCSRTGRSTSDPGEGCNANCLSGKTTTHANFKTHH